jgi:hypothetical protein
MTQLIDIADLDCVYLSYDEPRKEETWIKIQNMIPWAQRVDGIKGSDAAHKAAANASSTDRFVLIDGDNIPDTEFFNLQLTLDDNNADKVFRWKARNTINGLMYGNGGLSCWTKEFVYAMKTHENTDGSEANDVEFCFYPDYWAMHDCYSTTYPNGSPFQAWRAGFREGVKMTLLDGEKVPPQEIKERIWWHNIHRLKMWSTVGMHEENGVYAILGARMGTWMTNCTDWNYVDVRDFELLKNIYKEKVNHDMVEQDAKDLGIKLKQQLGLDWPWLDAAQSKYTLDLYDETLELNITYYNRTI